MNSAPAKANKAKPMEGKFIPTNKLPTNINGLAKAVNIFKPINLPFAKFFKMVFNFVFTLLSLGS
jgi:hypothetical protein